MFFFLLSVSSLRIECREWDGELTSIRHKVLSEKRSIDCVCQYLVDVMRKRVLLYGMMWTHHVSSYTCMSVCIAYARSRAFYIRISNNEFIPIFNETKNKNTKIVYFFAAFAPLLWDLILNVIIHTETSRFIALFCSTVHSIVGTIEQMLSDFSFLNALNAHTNYGCEPTTKYRSGNNIYTKMCVGNFLFTIFFLVFWIFSVSLVLSIVQAKRIKKNILKPKRNLFITCPLFELKFELLQACFYTALCVLFLNSVFKNNFYSESYALH